MELATDRFVVTHSRVSSKTFFLGSMLLAMRGKGPSNARWTCRAGRARLTLRLSRPLLSAGGMLDLCECGLSCGWQRMLLDHFQLCPVAHCFRYNNLGDADHRNNEAILRNRPGSQGVRSTSTWCAGPRARQPLPLNSKAEWSREVCQLSIGFRDRQRSSEPPTCVPLMNICGTVSRPGRLRHGMPGELGLPQMSELFPLQLLLP